MNALLIVPYAREAKMLFGTVYMERILEAADARGIPFEVLRDRVWEHETPPEEKQAFMSFAQRGYGEGPIPGYVPVWLSA